MGTFRLPDHHKIYFLKKSLCHGIKHHVFDIYCWFGYMKFKCWNKILRKQVLSFWVLNPESRAAILDFWIFSQKTSFNTSNGCFDVLGNMQMWKLPILVFLPGSHLNKETTRTLLKKDYRPVSLIPIISKL